MTTTEPKAVNRWVAEFADAVRRAGGRPGTHDRAGFTTRRHRAPACPP
jgi:hypothetical protein